MQFSEFVKYLNKLEQTSKRLEITDILSDLIKNLDTEETDKAINLSLGYLNARYDTKKFNLADKMMVRGLEKAYPHAGELTQAYKDSGDLGNVALDVHKSTKKTGLTIANVHELLTKIADTEGTGSQDAKINQIAELLQQMDKLSAKFIVRIILGTTRLGFTELTIADALSNFLAGDKSLKKEIESKYFAHPDIGLIAKIIKKDGIGGLEKVKLETGVPILGQRAQRISGIEETVEKLGECWAEYKFDGTRVQLHLDKNKKFEVESNQQELFAQAKEDNYLVKTYTRNLEDSTHQHPDIVEAAMKQIKAASVILDGEAIGIDKETGEFLPFQQIMQRKRKHAVKEIASEIPLKYFVFDIMYKDGESLIHLPLKERHEIIKKVLGDGEVIQPAEHILTDNVEELSDYFNNAKEHNLEGLIVKKPGDPYKAGARSYSWVKLKLADEKLLDDSMDLVVLGYYKGKGDRSKFGIGGFLVGILDQETETFKTITKVGTGLKDDDWRHLKELADKHKVNEVPKNVELPKDYMPDVITDPKIVVEIGADEISVSKTHSAGYALRFPRLLFFRTDKDASQVTNLKEIKKLHSLQKRGSYGK